MDTKLFSKVLTGQREMFPGGEDFTTKSTITFELEGYIRKLWIRRSTAGFKSIRFLVDDQVLLDFDGHTILIMDAFAQPRRTAWNEIYAKHHGEVIDLLNLDGMKECLNIPGRRRRIQLIDPSAYGDIFLHVVTDGSSEACEIVGLRRLTSSDSSEPKTPPSEAN